MLLRHLADGYILIPQPSHARISGQIAAAWREDYFPRDDIALAAAIHDIGWSTEEHTVYLNPETGMPCDFLDLPKSHHIGIWNRASRLALAFGRYIALMVSRHGTALYANFDFSSLSNSDEALVRNYLHEQEKFQTALIESLNKDNFYAPFVANAYLEKNTEFILLLDLMSIVLCTDFSDQMMFKSTDFSLKRLSGEAVVVTPWPFKKDKVSLLVEGRKLSGKFENQHKLDEAFANAEWQSFETHLLQSD